MSPMPCDRGRRRFLRGSLALAGLGVLSGCGLPPQARSAGRPARLGWLMPNSPDSPADAEFTRAFQQGLRDLGYVEGQNLAIEYRAAEGQFDRLPELAAELARLPLDVVFAQSTPGGIAAKAAITGIPVVTVAADPVGQGLVASLARPGGNVTGLTTSFAGIYEKKVELLKDAVPPIRHLAFLTAPSTPPSWVGETAAAAQRLGLAFRTVQARTAEGFDGAFAELTSNRVEALSVAGSPLFQDNRWRLAERAGAARLPTIADQRPYAEAGCLLAYGPNFANQYRRAATYVDKILKGAKPADLPVELPTTFDFVINLKTARALGLTLPQSVLQQATEVIQ